MTVLGRWIVGILQSVAGNLAVADIECIEDFGQIRWSFDS